MATRQRQWMEQTFCLVEAWHHALFLYDCELPQNVCHDEHGESDRTDVQLGAAQHD